MKILSYQQIKELDQVTIEQEPISSINLMERASQTFTRWFTERFYKDQKVIVFCGTGNNGGDGLAIARLLLQRMYDVEVYVIASNNQSEDFSINYDRLLSHINIEEIKNTKDLPTLSEDIVIIDAIFGTGINKVVDGIHAETIQHINNSKASKVAVDMPSGLYIDKHTDHTNIIKADYTVTFQLPKISLLLQENFEYVGEWFMLHIGLNRNYIDNAPTNFFYINDSSIKNYLRKRKKFDHKGNNGKALIITGSYGMLGASVLSTKSCLRSGAGLVYAFVPEAGFFVLQNDMPEILVLLDEHPEIITQCPDLSPYDSIGIGPGMGEAKETIKAFDKILTQATKPMVIDASAINMLALHPKLLTKIPAKSILTPHLKEFERLAGAVNNDYERIEKAIAIAQKFDIYIILKGAHSAICTPEGNVYFNSTGNPGMATAGSGDVLTGIITSLLAQGYTSEQASIVGVFMHGYAGDAAARKNSIYSMIASDIIDGITLFYKDFIK